VLNTIIIAAVGIGIALVAAMVFVLVIADRRNQQFELKPLDTSYGYETDEYKEPPETGVEGIDSAQVSDGIKRLASMMRLKRGGRPILLPLIAIPFFAGELVMIILGVRMVMLSKASLDWPTASGTVLSSYVDEDSSGRTTPRRRMRMQSWRSSQRGRRRRCITTRISRSSRC
jgi:hypothetical protein